MNALRKTAEKVSAGASKQVAKPRRSKDRHATPILIQRRGRTQTGLACQIRAPLANQATTVAGQGSTLPPRGSTKPNDGRSC
jgi:hypothetical protein